MNAVDVRFDRRESASATISEAAAAEHCGYFDRSCKDPVRAFQRWARRWGVPVKRVGRARRYDPRVLDAFMDREAWTSRHREPVAPQSVTRRPLNFVRHDRSVQHATQGR